MRAARGHFWLTVVTANYGRGYGPGVFRRNVLRTLEHTDGTEHVALLLQEVDEEPDPANEHRQLRAELEPGSRRVYWRTREPIILSPGFDVVRRRQVTIMGSGLELGAARGTGPSRPLNLCAAVERRTGIRLAFGTMHPHRSGLSPKVDAAREEGEIIASRALRGASTWLGGTSGFYGTDWNHRRMPRMVRGERTAIDHDLDHLRFWEHPDGARITLKATGRLNGTIDPHDPLWARFLVEAR